MRSALFLATLALTTPALAQRPDAACGAPGALSVRAFAERLAAFAPTDPVPLPTESAGEWGARRERDARATARVAARALGPRRTFRVGGRVRAEAGGGRLFLDDAVTPESLMVVAGVGYSDVMTGRREAVTAATEAGYGVAARGGALEIWDPSVAISRREDRALAARPACFFLVARLHGDEAPVLGLDRAELVTVIGGVPHVRAWALGDDGAGRPPALPEPLVLDYTAYVLPEIIGGREAVQAHLVYPEADRAAGVSGTVTVHLIVSPEGVPYDVEAVRAPSEGLGRAAVEAVRQVRFTPGVNWGEPVAVRQLIPVAFVLW